MNPKATAIYKESVLQLTPIYGESEAQSITNIFFEDLIQISRIQRLTDSELYLSSHQQSVYKNAMARLLQQEPVQHIVGHTYFINRKFHVTQDTLIPRPETEELVLLIANEHQKRNGLRILDIGTGTGCIAISLEIELNNPQVTAWDISSNALTIASKNAESLGSLVTFEQRNILTDTPQTPQDIIVSNPPYIPESDQVKMHQNVLDYEPRLALFVPDKDPLVFYRRIAQVGQNHLAQDGKLYFEIHENFGPQIRHMLTYMGYADVQIFQDLNGKDRITKALKA